MKFAVYFGNRGFFSGELIESAIADYKKALAANVETFSNYLGWEIDRI